MVASYLEECDFVVVLALMEQLPFITMQIDHSTRIFIYYEYELTKQDCSSTK